MTHSFRGADLVVNALEAAGVQYVFTLSGNQIMPLFDACIDSSIALIHVRHEAAAVHMADAWGRLTGEPGVALLTAGPGHANMLSAMYVGLMAESPMVVLSGHAPHAARGRGTFQEMAQAEMAGHVAKASWTANDATQLGHDIARAFRMANSGRPGPVHVSLPFDLLEAPLASARGTKPQADDFHPTLSLFDSATARNLLDAIDQASSPLILAGPAAMRGASADLLSQLEAKLFVPCVGMESPRGINDPSLGAFVEVLAKADLIVLIAKKVDFTLRFADEPIIDPTCRLIQIDPEMSVLEKTNNVLNDASRLTLTDLSDSTPALDRLLQLADQLEWSDNDWHQEVRTTIQYRPSEWDDVQTEPGQRLHAANVCRTVREFLMEDEDAVFISDGGEFGQWAQACVNAPHRVINGPSGSIGSALPFALAARLAYPNSHVATLLGDGTFGFLPLEFDTALRYQLPFIAVVGNDARWNAEHQIQLRNYGPERLLGCELSDTRYDQLVAALGGHGEHVTQNSDLRPALQRALESGVAACVNVAIESHAAPVIRRGDPQQGNRSI